MKKSLLLLLLIGTAIITHAQEKFVPGDIIVMLRPGASVVDVAKDLQTVNNIATSVHVVKEISAPMRAWLFRFDPAALPQAVMLRAFQTDAGIEMAQNNHLGKERSIPNDPNYSQQWQHQNIDSEGAWDVTTGGLTALGDTIVVAIMENADLPHPDLVANAWHNIHEIADNGIDDDGNGYIDDVRGWNPGNGTDNAYGGSHGTEVAGMIGAVGNNGQQVVGANWHVKMMPVQYASAAESDVIAAYTYPLVMRRLYNSTAGASGACVVATNASWGVDGGQPSDAPLWCAMYDTLGTAGILNCGATANNNVDIDVVGDLPTACPSDFMISVTATNSSDNHTFSGYGLTTIDVGAPGQNVVTTALGGGIASVSGTSFASPLTAGVIALLYSAPCPSLAALMHNDPTEAAMRVRQALFNGVDHVGNLPGQTVTGGRINANNSMQLILDSCASCPTPYNLTQSSIAIGQATLSWSALPGSYNVRYRLVGAGTWTEVDGLANTDLVLTGLSICQPYEYQVAADCDTSSSAFSPSFVWTSEGCCTAPVTITATATDTSSAVVNWSTVLASSSYDLRHREIGTTDWTELDGLTGNSVTLNNLPSCSDHEVQMRSSCGATMADWSPSTTFHVPGCGQCIEGSFCASSGSDEYEWIAEVAIAGIDRTSAGDGGYADVDVTNQSTELVIGHSYPITLAPGYDGDPFNEYFTVWIDLNRDGQFAANELVFDAGNTVMVPLNSTLTVPMIATPGAARMRVQMQYDSPSATGCGSYQFGETEDYCISLVTTASGIPENPAATVVKVYPQPANDVVNFITGGTGNEELLVMDASGRALLNLPVRNGFISLPTQGLSDGLYVYHVRAKGVDRARGTFMVVH